MDLIKDYKSTYALLTMSQVINQPDLSEFLTEVESIDFEGTPNYDKLR